MVTFPARFKAIKVTQPLGTFYVACIPANVLLQVAYSDVLSAALDDAGTGYVLEGTQRVAQTKRLAQIADYIDRDDAAFPNSIILAANFRQDGSIEDPEPDEDEDQAVEAHSAVWTISETSDTDCLSLEIPTAAKLAAIIDGQHRLFAFTNIQREDRLDMEILCSIYLDLPKPFQAQLFATINSTQKPVDKSLTYELFGYNIAEEREEFWTPDKLAVFLTRKLNTEEDSPLRGRIVIAPKRDAALTALAKGGWKVSTAVVVEGLMRLYTANPKRDTNEMLSPGSRPRSVLSKFKDKSPMRQVFLDGNDAVTYKMAINYLRACDAVFWSKAKSDSFILRTAGIQALFGILRSLSSIALAEKDVSEEFFSKALKPAEGIDFAADEYRNSSGSGRSYIRRAIERRIGLLKAS